MKCKFNNHVHSVKQLYTLEMYTLVLSINLNEQTWTSKTTNFNH